MFTFSDKRISSIRSTSAKINNGKSQSLFTGNLDYSKDYFSFKSDFEASLRSFPTAPYYTIDNIILILKDKRNIEINEENFLDLRPELFALDKVQFTITVTTSTTNSAQNNKKTNTPMSTKENIPENKKNRLGLFSPKTNRNTMNQTPSTPIAPANSRMAIPLKSTNPMASPTHTTVTVTPSRSLMPFSFGIRSHNNNKEDNNNNTSMNSHNVDDIEISTTRNALFTDMDTANVSVTSPMRHSCRLPSNTTNTSTSNSNTTPGTANRKTPGTPTPTTTTTTPLTPRRPASINISTGSSNTGGIGAGGGTVVSKKSSAGVTVTPIKSLSSNPFTSLLRSPTGGSSFLSPSKSTSTSKTAVSVSSSSSTKTSVLVDNKISCPLTTLQQSQQQLQQQLQSPRGCSLSSVNSLYNNNDNDNDNDNIDNEEDDLDEDWRSTGEENIINNDDDINAFDDNTTTTTTSTNVTLANNTVTNHLNNINNNNNNTNPDSHSDHNSGSDFVVNAAATSTATTTTTTRTTLHPFAFVLSPESLKDLTRMEEVQVEVEDDMCARLLNDYSSQKHSISTTQNTRKLSTTTTPPVATTTTATVENNNSNSNSNSIADSDNIASAVADNNGNNCNKTDNVTTGGSTSTNSDSSTTSSTPISIPTTMTSTTTTTTTTTCNMKNIALLAQPKNTRQKVETSSNKKKAMIDTPLPPSFTPTQSAKKRIKSNTGIKPTSTFKYSTSTDVDADDEVSSSCSNTIETSPNSISESDTTTNTNSNNSNNNQRLAAIPLSTNMTNMSMSMSMPMKTPDRSARNNNSNNNNNNNNSHSNANGIQSQSQSQSQSHQSSLPLQRKPPIPKTPIVMHNNNNNKDSHSHKEKDNRENKDFPRRTLTLISSPTQSSLLHSTNSELSSSSTVVVRSTAEEIDIWTRGLRGGLEKNTATSTKSAKKKGGGGKGGGRGDKRMSMHTDDMMRAMRRETLTLTLGDGSGRPSMDTMMQQWAFLKATFVNSEEELEWLMLSKDPRAYHHAKKKDDAAEDKYYKTLFDIDVLDAKLKLLKGGVAQLPLTIKEIINIGNKYTNAASDENGSVNIDVFKYTMSALTETRNTIKELIFLDLKNMFSIEFDRELDEIADGFKITNSTGANNNLTELFQKAKHFQNFTIPDEIRKINVRKAVVIKTSEENLKEMEKWSTRAKETNEYSKIMREEEEAWFAKEKDANEAALRIMQSFIPLNITELSNSEMSSLAKRGMWPSELTTEIKYNKLLHWLITHPDDIAWATFLTGEQKQYFENIENLDIIELRALCICLPAKFELDGDGKKGEWRNRVIARTKQLVAQFNRDVTKGGWDPEQNKRVMVKLPPLKADLLRRPIYFYRTKDQILLKIKQMEDRYAMLKKKEGWLAAAEEVLREAKLEYETILGESRDADVKKSYGADIVARAKEMAKKELQESESKKRVLLQDVTNLRKTLSESVFSKESWLIGMEEVQLFINDQFDLDWVRSDSPIQIQGLFDSNPVITRRERNAAKFVTAEQEADQRKLEIAMLNKSRKEALTAPLPPALLPLPATVTVTVTTADITDNIATTVTATSTTATASMTETSETATSNNTSNGTVTDTTTTTSATITDVTVTDVTTTAPSSIASPVDGETHEPLSSLLLSLQGNQSKSQSEIQLQSESESQSESKTEMKSDSRPTSLTLSTSTSTSIYSSDTPITISPVSSVEDQVEEEDLSTSFKPSAMKKGSAMALNLNALLSRQRVPPAASYASSTKVIKPVAVVVEQLPVVSSSTSSLSSSSSSTSTHAVVTVTQTPILKRTKSRLLKQISGIRSPPRRNSPPRNTIGGGCMTPQTQMNDTPGGGGGMNANNLLAQIAGGRCSVQLPLAPPTDMRSLMMQIKAGNTKRGNININTNNSETHSSTTTNTSTLSMSETETVVPSPRFRPSGAMTNTAGGASFLAELQMRTRSNTATTNDSEHIDSSTTSTSMDVAPILPKPAGPVNFLAELKMRARKDC